MSSINFQEPYSEETKKMLEEAFGNASAKDALTMLFDANQTKLMDARLMKAVANEEKQPVEVCLHAPGEIKTMGDGTKYQVDEHGSWRRIWP